MNHLPPEILKHLDDYQTAMLDMANDVRKLQNNFEIHMENQIKYAGEVIKLGKQLEGLCNTISELQVKVNPLVDNFQGLNWTRKALMWLLIFLGAIGSLALMVKKLYQ